jgi:hypothetical protein
MKDHCTLVKAESTGVTAGWSGPDPFNFAFFLAVPIFEQRKDTQCDRQLQNQLVIPSDGLQKQAYHMRCQIKAQCRWRASIGISTPTNLLAKPKEYKKADPCTRSHDDLGRDPRHVLHEHFSPGKS